MHNNDEKQPFDCTAHKIEERASTPNNKSDNHIKKRADMCLPGRPLVGCTCVSMGGNRRLLYTNVCVHMCMVNG